MLVAPALMCVRLAPAALATVVLLACGSGRAPETDPARRIWSGPTAAVSSEGVTIYDRREIAQKVPYPTCITAGTASFRFGDVSRTNTSFVVPAGLFESGYYLDRWRLLVAAGTPETQPKVFVSALGATGIIAEYPRLPEGVNCTP